MHRRAVESLSQIDAHSGTSHSARPFRRRMPERRDASDNSCDYSSLFCRTRQEKRHLSTRTQPLGMADRSVQTQNQHLLTEIRIFRPSFPPSAGLEAFYFLAVSSEHCNLSVFHSTLRSLLLTPHCRRPRRCVHPSC